MKYNYILREVYMPKKHFKKDRIAELSERENVIFSLLWINKKQFRSWNELSKVLYGEETNKQTRSKISLIIHRMRKKGIPIKPLYKKGFVLKEE